MQGTTSNSPAIAVAENPIIPHTPEISAIEAKKRKEQERTRLKKELFLQEFERFMGGIYAAAHAAGIDPSTYYDWIKDDAEFLAKVRSVKGRANDKAESILNELMVKRHAPSVHFYLSHKHPEYKTNVKVEHVIGERTLEDLLDEEINNGTNEQGTDRGTPQDPEQAGADGEVPLQPGPDLLLGSQDAPEHPTESATEGTL